MTSRGIKISPADPEEAPGRAATLTLSRGESLLSTRDEGAQKLPLTPFLHILKSKTWSKLYGGLKKGKN